MVLGTELKPVINDAKGITFKDIEEFYRREMIAQVVVCLNVEPKFKKVIENSETVNSVWIKL